MVKPLSAFAAALAALLAAQSAAAADLQTLFSCATATGRVISLTQDTAQGTVTYRYGRRGQRPELQLTRSFADTAYGVDSTGRNSIETVALTRRPGIDYIVYGYYGFGGDEYGVAVYSGKRVVEVARCRGKPAVFALDRTKGTKEPDLSRDPVRDTLNLR